MITSYILCNCLLESSGIINFGILKHIRTIAEEDEFFRLECKRLWVPEGLGAVPANSSRMSSLDKDSAGLWMEFRCRMMACYLRLSSIVQRWSQQEVYSIQRAPTTIGAQTPGFKWVSRTIGQAQSKCSNPVVGKNMGLPMI